MRALCCGVWALCGVVKLHPQSFRFFSCIILFFYSGRSLRQGRTGLEAVTTYRRWTGEAPLWARTYHFSKILSIFLFYLRNSSKTLKFTNDESTLKYFTNNVICILGKSMYYNPDTISIFICLYIV